MKNAIAAALIVSSCAPAYAQQVTCFPVDHVYQELTEKHRETKVFEGLAHGGVLEVWAGGKGWTAFVVQPSGQACIVASGVDYGNYELPGQL